MLFVLAVVAVSALTFYRLDSKGLLKSGEPKIITSKRDCLKSLEHYKTD